MRKSLKEVLMIRDGMSEEQAEREIAEASADLRDRIEDGDSSADDICEEYWGLEPDYLEDLV